MTNKEYEELYCMYCDSQRCHNVPGLTPEQMCPYWKERKKILEEKKNEICKT
jgi:hypothetical protein